MTHSQQPLHEDARRGAVRELCRHRQLELLSVIHLFCNCAAVYICFPADSPSLAPLVAQQAALAPQPLQEPPVTARGGSTHRFGTQNAFSSTSWRVMEEHATLPEPR